MQSLFIKQLLLFLSGLLVIVILITLFIYREDIGRNGFKSMPTNNFSNSISFNSQIQHLHSLHRTKETEFLVLGSSMALNNIAAELIEDSIQQKTYNFSSWGLKSQKLLEIVQTIEFEKCRTVLIPFSNQDLYDSAHFDIKDLELVNNYLNSKNTAWYKAAAFLYNFNFSDFRKNWSLRSKDLYRLNTYSSLSFDSCGSVLINTTGFVFSKKRNERYFDTTGFTAFMQNITAIKSLLNKKNISFKLAYMPWRDDLITPERESANNAIASILHRTFKDEFIDLHNLKLEKALFCDGTHLFKDGAKIITRNIIDSLKSRH